MSTSDWFRTNREAIHQRVAWMLDRPQGKLHHRRSERHRLLVTKEGSLIRLFFLDPFFRDDQLKLSGCMSELDLSDPLKLVVAYTQALLLPLLWRDEPTHVNSIGFAGGRVPLALHHYFPNVVIDNTDIDAEVKYVAERYFGVKLDERQKLTIRDGRAHLQAREADTRYDFILVDAFEETGYSPYPLSTKNFYELCKEHLAEDGVVVTNLINDDPLLLEKINTMKAAFRHVYVHFDPAFIETYVVLGTDGEDLNESERVERATRIQERFNFPFPYVRRARDLKPLAEQAAHLAQLGSTTEILYDERPPDPPVRAILSTRLRNYTNG